MPYLGFFQDVQIGVQKVSFKLYILLYIYAEIKGTNLKLLEVTVLWVKESDSLLANGDM